MGCSSSCWHYHWSSLCSPSFRRQGRGERGSRRRAARDNAIGRGHIMQAFESGQAVRWIKPKRLQLRFELQAGEATVATLAWTRGSRALAQSAGSAYWFTREGFFRPRVLIRRATDTSANAPTGQEVI